MIRKGAIRIAAISTPLVAALLYIAINWYRIEPEPTWVGAGAEARKDPYLAYTRLLDRMGGRPRAISGPTQLETLPKDATLLLGSRRLAYVTPERLRSITSWVEHGGHIVVEAEPFAIDDPLLEALGIERLQLKPPKQNSEQWSQWSKRSEALSAPTFEWPGAGRPLTVRFGPDKLWEGIRDTRSRPALAQIRIGDHAIALAFAMGEGRVSVLPSFSYLRNNSIGMLDHAEFGWLLASSHADRAPALLFLKMDSPPFLEWLWREAWAVVLAAALFVALWLARIIPRFGPLAPEPPPVRRSLLEHIVASGRFLWSRGKGGYLLDAVRERVLGSARRRGIATQLLSQSKAAAALAELAAMPEPAVRTALEGQAATPEDFVAAAAALHRIESSLAQRRFASAQPGKSRP